MTRKFINRDKEILALEEFFRRKEFRVAIIYGRRRTGKTTLIKKFLENRKSIYFLCSRRKIEYNLKKFSQKVCEHLTIPKITFGNFVDIFKFLSKNIQGAVVAIDEFGYLIEKDEGVLSDFQEIIDGILVKSGIKLILCGSSISMMESKVMGYKSPLYGRSEMQIKIKPLNFEEIFRWFPSLNFEDNFKIFAATHNIPKYLEFFYGKEVEKEIVKNFFKVDSFLYNDVSNLLSEELRDPTTYFQILEGIALGYTKPTEIANYTYIETKDIYFYIKILSKLGIVKKEISIFSKRKEKRGLYKIDDNYFNFWFTFVSPFQEEIESYSLDEVITNFKKRFSAYLGKIFENLILDLLKRKRINILPFTKIGKWWHKDKEIDVVAINEKTKEILFAECKWKSKVNALKVVKELAEKSNYVDWNREKRRESFAVFAKSFSKRIGEFEGKKVYCFDLKDLGKIMRGKRVKVSQ